MRDNNLPKTQKELHNIIDQVSETGEVIKELLKRRLSIPYTAGENTSVYITSPNGLYQKTLTMQMMKDFYTKYCLGNKALKDDIYYNLNFARNNYEFLTVSRDIEKSPRKINPRTEKQRTQINRREQRIYHSTYDDIQKDPDMIANYYNKKYSLSNESNIVTVFTEDDIMCLKCGCISDERLTDVPDRNLHIKNFKCPKCESVSSSIATYDKYLNKLCTVYRENLD